MAEEKKLFTLSELARGFAMDRETLRNRILDAGIEPVSQKKNEKFYDLDEVTAIFESAGDIEREKFRKMKAEADLKELELAIKRGEFCSKSEFVEIVQKIFSNLHKRVAVQQPNRLANKLFKAKSPNEIAQLLKDDSNKIFNALRTDFTDFL